MTSAPPPPPLAPSRGGVLRHLPALVLAVAVAATWANGLANGFAWDDHPVVVQGSAEPGLDGVLRALTAPDVALPSQPAPYYRPLARLGFVADRWLFGLDPTPYHLESVALHLAAALLLYALGRRIAGEPAPAFVAALLFAVHPVNAETVDFVSARNNALVAVFALGACLAWLRARATGRAGPLLAACGLFLLALASKETGLMLLPFLALHAWTSPSPREEGARPTLLRLGALAAVAAAFLALRAAILAGAGGPAFPLASPGDALVRALHVVPRYLALAIFPAGLTVHHPEPETFLAHPVALAAAWLAIAAATALLVRQGRPATRYGLLWFAVHLLPVSGIVPIPSAALAERYLYVPAIGLWLVAGDQAALLARRFPRGRPVAWAVALVALALAAVTVRRNRDWRDDLALFSSAVRVDPGSVEASYNLGVALDARGRGDDARREWERTLTLDPTKVEALARLGTFHAERGAYDVAARYFARVLALRPGHVETRFNLALLLERLGRPAEALEQYRAFLRLGPVDYPELERRVRERVRALGGAPADGR